jgi:uncharacterized protein YfkK (UPF0435 family)
MDKRLNITANLKEKKRNEVWIISNGTYVNLDPGKICDTPVSGPVTEYKISELAKYLLDPNPITLEETIIGCEVKYRKPRPGIIKRLLRKTSPDKKSYFREEIISASKVGIPTFKDEGLNSHLLKIKELLRPYDPALKKISSLDREKIEDIRAICEQVGGGRYLLNLQGSINEKINYISSSLSKKAKVILNRAYMLNGLFEMRGFNFDSFNASNRYRLIKIAQNNQIRYCVLNDSYKFEFWVNNDSLVHYMHIFEQAIKIDSKLREALALSVRGEAIPIKLFFSKQLDQSYSEQYFPSTYREVFSSYNISPSEKDAIANMLNSFQNIVLFSYILKSGTGSQKLITNISVLHDLRALESLKDKLPHVYSEINKKVSVSEAGNLYLLDSLRGYKNV